MKLERESGGHRNAEGLLVLPRAGLPITEKIHAMELSLPIGSDDDRRGYFRGGSGDG